MSAALGAWVDMWGQTISDAGVVSTSGGNQDMVEPMPGMVTNEHNRDYLQEHGWGLLKGMGNG